MCALTLSSVMKKSGSLEYASCLVGFFCCLVVVAAAFFHYYYNFFLVVCFTWLDTYFSAYILYIFEAVSLSAQTCIEFNGVCMHTVNYIVCMFPFLSISVQFTFWCLILIFDIEKKKKKSNNKTKKYATAIFSMHKLSFSIIIYLIFFWSSDKKELIQKEALTFWYVRWKMAMAISVPLYKMTL